MNADLGQLRAALIPVGHFATAWMITKSIAVTSRPIYCDFVTSALALRVQPVSATPLEVYRLAFRSPRSFAVAD